MSIVPSYATVNPIITISDDIFEGTKQYSVVNVIDRVFEKTQ